jgi:hypothetical protein
VGKERGVERTYRILTWSKTRRVAFEAGIEGLKYGGEKGGRRLAESQDNSLPKPCRSSSEFDEGTSSRPIPESTGIN